MSARTECSALTHPEEVDFLEDIGEEIQLVSTTTEPNSISQYSIENDPIDSVKITHDFEMKNLIKSSNWDHSVNNKKASSNQKFPNSKFYSSLDDLCRRADEKHCSGVQSPENPSPDSAFVNFKLNKNLGNKKHGHIRSKVKHYFDPKYELTEKNLKTFVSSGLKESRNKDYLEEVNQQLTKELEEKNAILSLLQENYEWLLFKYAEAQNKIDELRFKCMAQNPESKNSTNQFKCNNNINSLPNRPLSLPLDNNIKLIDKGVMLTKAATPTDSEGLSSIITSMSGHSKILNSLDEENQENKKSLKCSTANFVLENSTSVNDPFDKVKKWQNSLPPLEQIETPETTLYSGFPNNSGYYSSDETKSPKNNKDYDFLDESCPTDWMDENISLCKSKSGGSSKRVSLHGTLIARKDFRSSHDKDDHRFSIMNGGDNDISQENGISSEGSQRSKSDINFDRKDRRGSKLLSRCSSLPAYDQDGIKLGIYKNGIYIPSLDLGNVTLSDDESYCQQNCYISKNNISVRTTSGKGKNHRCFPTSKSSSSCKITVSDENFSCRIPNKQTTAEKSTSMTPDRSNAPEPFLEINKIISKNDGVLKNDKGNNFQSPSDSPVDKISNRCNICGVFLPENKNYHSIRNRSNSYDSMHGSSLEKNTNSARNRSKPPFKRSVSFGSEALSSKFCSHQYRLTKNFNFLPSQESFESFEFYTNNLKARSQVVLKALTAHINNS